MGWKWCRHWCSAVGVNREGLTYSGISGNFEEWCSLNVGLILGVLSKITRFGRWNFYLLRLVNYRYSNYICNYCIWEWFLIWNYFIFILLFSLNLILLFLKFSLTVLLQWLKFYSSKVGTVANLGWTKGMVLDTFVVVARYDCRNGGSFAALLVDYRRRRRLIN